MSLVNWILDQLGDSDRRGGDVVNSYFVMSDLKDIRLTDGELCERAAFDSMAENAKNYTKKRDVPIGKKTWW